MKRVAGYALSVPFAIMAAFLAGPANADAPWPSFRGPQASGVASQETPTVWDREDGRNIEWETAVPGLGHGSPVVSDRLVFVVTAVGVPEAATLQVGLYGNPGAAKDSGEQSWRLYALDRKTGEVAWFREAFRGVPPVKRHTKGTHANATPATDGKSVVAFFGSAGLYCYDAQTGALRWKKNLGVLDAGSFNIPTFQWGFGNSPVIHNGKLVVLADVQKNAFLATYDLDDGRELWRVERHDVPTWGSPTVYDEAGTLRIAVNGYKHMGAYDFATGAEVWLLRGGGDVPIPTPIVGDGLIYLANAHGRRSPVYAVRMAARGDVTLAGDNTQNEGIAWSHPRVGAYMQTPILSNGLLFACRDNGVVKCYDAKTGAMQYEERLTDSGDAFTASPVAAGGKLYFTSEVGDVFVVPATPTFEVTAINALDEVTMATPAIANGTLYFRTQGHVVAIAEETDSGPPEAVGD